MGNTIWILNENTDEDEWDHPLILAYEKKLDDLANELGIKKISDFYDHSILAEEYGGDVEPHFVTAKDVKEIIQALVTAISSGKLNRNTELIEELEDCLGKIIESENQGLEVRIAIVP